MKGALKILVSGGGTGGHIFPAIAIANELKQMRPDAEFLFVGANGKMEMEKVPVAGYKIVGLTIAGFQRSLSLSNIFKNLLLPFKLVMSMMKALWVVSNFKPDVAIGTGGYASGPVLKICSWMGIPYFLQEQNSFPGVTNKILGLQAKGIFVAFENLEQFFPKEKIYLVGNPIRELIIKNQYNREEAIKVMGLDANKKTVFVTGGSLGARAINEGMANGIELLEKQNIQVIWQCGKVYLEQYKKHESANVKVLDFIEHMDAAYAAADMIVSRAGGTISELAVIGKPTILLPSPNVTDDHQTKNVEALVAKNATILIKDIDAKEKLCSTILELINDEQEQNRLREGIKTFARPDSVKEIASIILNKIEA